jgi:hypothetical protein
MLWKLCFVSNTFQCLDAVFIESRNVYGASFSAMW